MEAFTCKNYLLHKAPKKIQLFGDKTKKIEAAQHIIEFPGGAVEVSRTTDGNYWAHIIVNREEAIDDCVGLVSATGEIIGSRIDSGQGVKEIPHANFLTQIAVLIKAR